MAFYTAIALLGSGGLHAFAPGCQSGCCEPEAAATLSHSGCTHHHHAHRHESQGREQKPDDSPRQCPDGCLICEFAATPAVPVAIIMAPALAEFVQFLAPASERHDPLAASAPFWIRGPPSLG